MCLAVPLQIIEIHGQDAIGARDGIRRPIRLDFIKEPKLGDYVMVHAGFAIERVEPEEAQLFMEDLGLSETGLDRLIRTSYDLLGYISFLTAGEDDVHAWTIVKGTKAPKAAGKIHTDIERGFIRAEIVAFEDLKACGSIAAARDKGLFRLEGKDYVMRDGDVTNFRFNV